MAGSTGSGRELSLGLARRRQQELLGGRQDTPNAAIAASSITREDADRGRGA